MLLQHLSLVAEQTHLLIRQHTPPLTSLTMGLLNLNNSCCDRGIAAGVLLALLAVCIAMAVWPPIGPVMELGNEEALSQINAGDTGFVALCTAIVLLMTPGWVSLCRGRVGPASLCLPSIR